MKDILLLGKRIIPDKAEILLSDTKMAGYGRQMEL